MKLEMRPRMGLANIPLGTFPLLQVTLNDKKGRVRNNLKIKLSSLCITPDTHTVLYLECVTTNKAEEKVFSEAISEIDGTQQWAFCPTEDNGYIIHPQENMRVADVKLENGLHHFAMLSQEDTFIMAHSAEQLWHRLRKRMSCPTKAEWKEALMPRILASGMLHLCEAFGLPEDLKVYVLELDADQTFDDLVGQLVKENGL